MIKKKVKAEWDKELQCFRVELPGGHYTLVDREDLWIMELAGWSVNKKSGAVHANVQLHRLIKQARAGFDVDHENHNRQDNRRSNLRECTRGNNCKNKGKHRKSSSRYKGVSVRKNGSIIAMIGKRGYLGVFKTQKEAAMAYDEAARKKYGTFALTNSDLGLL